MEGPAGAVLPAGGHAEAVRSFDELEEEDQWDENWRDEDEEERQEGPAPDAGSDEEDANPFAPGSLDFDLDLLVEKLQWLEPLEADHQVRQALRRSQGVATDEDTVAVLLKIYCLVREEGLEGREPWDRALAYCRHMVELSDQNFRGPASGGAVLPEDFPAMVVAHIYATYGRTLALAGQPRPACEVLEKALHIYALMPTHHAVTKVAEVALTKASRARVMQRIGEHQLAVKDWVECLQALPGTGELEELLDEFLDSGIREAGEGGQGLRYLTTFVTGLAEEKFGLASQPHINTVKQAAQICAECGQPDLAGDLWVKLLEILGHWDDTPVMMVERIEREAAAAFEASVPIFLQKLDVQAAAKAWNKAFELRLQMQDSTPELLSSMEQTLEFLKEAASQASKIDPALKQKVQAGEAEVALPAISGVEEASSAAAGGGSSGVREERALPLMPPPRVAGNQLVMKPAWATKKPQAAPKAEAKPQDAKAVPESWEDA